VGVPVLIFKSDIAALAAVLLLCLGSPALAGPLDPPWEAAAPAKAQGPQAKGFSGGSALLGLVSVWQRALSPVDGIHCPSEPSCSRYAAQAVRRHGPALGAFMAADRLIHEASEGDWAPLVRTPGGYKIDDPVSNNDFWLNWR